MGTFVLIFRRQRPKKLVLVEAEGHGYVRAAWFAGCSVALCLSLC